MRKQFIYVSGIVFGTVFAFAYFWPPMLHVLWIVGPLFLLGVVDMFRNQHTILRNFPVLGHFRYWLEVVRPEIQQYFIESFSDGRPFSREQRSVVYQRAKKSLDTLPFGTQHDLYEPGQEWLEHSLKPAPILEDPPKVQVGGPDCTQPYNASLLNISAMSFGSLSKNAILALNKGAKMGGFAHNTGEGGVTPYHLEPGGDLIWQVGTGYFGCRTADGHFDYDQYCEKARYPSVKMIEIKISQGAKPGHGGILPGSKVNAEIAEIRGVPMWKDVISPPSHSEFTNPIELMNFIRKLREGSGGKPIGFKLCVGKKFQFLSICKAMLETRTTPDFITVDGAEGGTGAAPLEFSNSIGMPLVDGLVFVHNALVGVGLREKIKIICSGKITTGFHIASKLAIGADLCYSARGMMFALGCIQALRCNTNHCPTGVATQDEGLMAGLHVESKAERIKNFHEGTLDSFLEVLSAAGLAHPSDLLPMHIMRRTNVSKVLCYDELFEYLKPGDLVSGNIPETYVRPWNLSQASSF